MTALAQNYMALFNALGLCKFLFFARISHGTLGEWVKGLTGWQIDSPGLMEIGDRLYNLKRAYNVLLGISEKDDVMPARVYQLLRPGQPVSEGEKLFREMRRDYYAARGWNELGIPQKDKLISLGLEDAARRIKAE